MSITNSEKMQAKARIDDLVAKVISDSIIAGSLSGKSEAEKKAMANDAAGTIVDLQSEIEDIFNRI